VPTYQYACTECGHGFDIVQSFSDDSLTVCPECGGRLRKVFNAVGVVFKGSGFYRTDSRDKKTADAGAGSSSTDSTPSTTGSANGSSTTKAGSKADSAAGSTKATTKATSTESAKA
jgi:putative FmdB family regulatory protein